jgi:hypothetical protein
MRDIPIPCRTTVDEAESRIPQAEFAESNASTKLSEMADLDDAPAGCVLHAVEGRPAKRALDS